MPTFFRYLALLACLPLAALADNSPEEPGELVKLVIVSRHGVRNPTLPDTVLDQWIKQGSWPAWPVPGLGQLTPAGALLAEKMGGYYRAYLDHEGVFQAGACPKREEVYVWADGVERTVATGQAIASGLGPDCRLDIHVAAANPDPLFHPVQAQACPFDSAKALAAVLERLPPGGPADFNSRHKAEIAQMQDALQCCKPALAEGGLADVPTTLTANSDQTGVSAGGALDIAATAGEIFLLEYAQGFPAAEVGWGRVKPEDLQGLLRLHNLAFDLTQRTPYIAKRLASPLLAAVAAALADSGPGKGAKFVGFIGHDTNIANLSGLLNVDWNSSAELPDRTAPAGALAFELRKHRDGRLDVRLAYLAESVTQMREQATLSWERPPLRIPLALPGCSREGAGYSCELGRFQEWVAGLVERECRGLGNF